MKNPPCSSKITYRTLGDDGFVTSALFSFSASVVQAIAKKVIKETDQVEGLRDISSWASLRNEHIAEPTELPSVLVNFDYICEGLIEAGHGQAHCLACNKIYSVTELANHNGFTGSCLIDEYKCPAQHMLMSREVAHFMFYRNTK
jgi:hypothetical protein